VSKNNEKSLRSWIAKPGVLAFASFVTGAFSVTGARRIC